MVGDGGDVVYRFDEAAYAAAPVRLRQSWKDFKRQQELDRTFVLMTDEQDTSVASEGFDYGSISIARVVLTLGFKAELETTLDLYAIGKAIGPELAQTMESMHTAEPHDGYRPIAWHYVFWKIGDEYHVLMMALDERAPFCDTVQTLADHIVSNYREVKSTSRPSVSRRRTKLYDACEKLVQDRVCGYLGMTR
jgi:hypothetical protein